MQVDSQINKKVNKKRNGKSQIVKWSNVKKSIKPKKNQNVKKVIETKISKKEKCQIIE